MSTDGSKVPWTPERCSMIDFCLIPGRWRNAVHHVESKPTIAISSDHAMFIAKVKLNLKAEKTIEPETVVRYRKPTK